VIPGTKITANTDTGQPALVVYVTAKSPNPANPVPKEFAGIPIDVRELPTPTSDQFCNVPMFGVSWPKFDQVMRAGREIDDVPHDSLVDTDPAGRVLILPDPE